MYMQSIAGSLMCRYGWRMFSMSVLGFEFIIYAVYPLAILYTYMYRIELVPDRR